MSENKGFVFSNSYFKDVIHKYPDQFTLCYNESEDKHYCFLGTSWVEDASFKKGTNSFGTLRKIGDKYYVCNGKGGWVLFGQKVPRVGDLLNINGHHCVYSGGRWDEIITGDNERVWTYLKKLYSIYILVDKLEKIIGVNYFIDEVTNLLSEHMGPENFGRWVDVELDKKLKNKVDGCVKGVNLSEFDLIIDQLSESDIEEIWSTIPENDFDDCVQTYIPIKFKKLHSFFGIYCNGKTCKNCYIKFWSIFKNRGE